MEGFTKYIELFHTTIVFMSGTHNFRCCTVSEMARRSGPVLISIGEEFYEFHKVNAPTHSEV